MSLDWTYRSSISQDLAVINIDTLRGIAWTVFLNLLQAQVKEESCEGLGEAVRILLYLLLGGIEKGV